MTKTQLGLFFFINLVCAAAVSIGVVRWQLQTAHVESSAPSQKQELTALDPAQASFAKKTACTEDAQRLCPQLKDLELDGCLQDHFAQVGRDCHDELFRSRVAMSDCEHEIDRFCAKTPYGGGRMRKCLLQFAEKLGKRCQALIRVD